MSELKLAPPWIIYVNELKALFGNDPSIRMEYDNNNLKMTLYVEGQRKADAITQLLPTEKQFGNVTLEINVVPANPLGNSKINLFRDAFEGNDSFVDTYTVEGAFNNPISYVVFKKEVVQFHTDDLSDLNGIRSTLYQDIAKEIFGEQQGIFFCTEKV